MRVIEIPFGAVGIDCLSPISAAVAKELATYVLPGTRTGFTFVTRYLENLTIAELNGIFAAGLGVAFVAEARISEWSGETGASDGAEVVALAKKLSLPAGGAPLLHLICDMEGMVNCTAADASAYGAAWGKAVAGGFASEGYVGDSVPLSPMQLYVLPFTGYWRSLSNVQQVADADYYKYQAYPTQTLHLPSGPFAVDLDFVCRDKKGRLPTMAVAA